MSKDWQLRRDSLVAGHLSAVKLRSFYATSETKKQFNNKFLYSKSILILLFKNK